MYTHMYMETMLTRWTKSVWSFSGPWVLEQLFPGWMAAIYWWWTWMSIHGCPLWLNHRWTDRMFPLKKTSNPWLRDTCWCDRWRQRCLPIMSRISDICCFNNLSRNLHILSAIPLVFLGLPGSPGPPPLPWQDQIQKIEVVKPQIIQRTVRRKKPIIQETNMFS